MEMKKQIRKPMAVEVIEKEKRKENVTEETKKYENVTRPTTTLTTLTNENEVSNEEELNDNTIQHFKYPPLRTYRLPQLDFNVSQDVDEMEWIRVEPPLKIMEPIETYQSRAISKEQQVINEREEQQINEKEEQQIINERTKQQIINDERQAQLIIKN